MKFKRAIPVFAALVLQAASFDVASVKPANPNAVGSNTDSDPGRITMQNVTLKRCIMRAYEVPDLQITGGPKWLDSELYDIRAKVPAGKGQLSMDEHYRRVQTLLTDRLRLRVHHEAKNESVYFLRVAKSGLRMAPDSSPSGTGSILPWSMIVSELSRITGWPVIDETGLKGAWHFGIRYSEETGPSIFTAVQEQLGLRLDAGKGPVDQLVIDSVERPSGN